MELGKVVKFRISGVKYRIYIIYFYNIFHGQISFELYNILDDQVFRLLQQSMGVVVRPISPVRKIWWRGHTGLFFQGGLALIRRSYIGVAP